MQTHKLNYTDTGLLSGIIQDYLEQNDRQRELYKYSFEIGSIPTIIADKQGSTDRQLLVNTLNWQYQDLNINQLVNDNIASLGHKNTFTVTTAHQPNVFTGFLFFVNKLASTVALANTLNLTYPDYHFVPVYWMGGEDHDFEEINHINLFGERLEWHNELSGPVGRMNIVGLGNLIDTIEAKLSNEPYGSELISLLRDAYSNGNTLAAATRTFVNSLFGKYGLVVVDGDSPTLKAAFSQVMYDEIINERVSDLIAETVGTLEDNNYKVQANPREINLFYIEDGLRERVVKQPDGSFGVLNTDIAFTADELKVKLQEHPERFSPNVFLRPVYQEFILPNLAYVGGAGELAYWLELRRVFEHYGVNYPMLVLRNHIAILDANTEVKRQKLGLEIADLFRDEDQLIKDYVKQHTSTALDLKTEKEATKQLFAQIKDIALEVDPSLDKTVDGTLQGQLNALNALESKLLRAEKRNQEVAVNQIQSIKSKLFPNGTLMERQSNALPYWARYGTDFISILVEAFDPFEKQFILFTE